MSTGNGLDQRARSGSQKRKSVAESIHRVSDRIAEAVTDRQFSDNPELSERYGSAGRQKCTADAKRHLSYLSSAIAQDSDAIFVDYVGWAKILLIKLGIHYQDLTTNLRILKSTIETVLPASEFDVASRVIEVGLAQLSELPATSTSYLDSGMAPHEDLARRYLALLLAGQRQEASTLILEAVSEGTSVRDIYMHVFQTSQYEIGRLWQTNEISVAQEHFCTAATQLIMSQLYPNIFSTARANRRLVAACVGGDLHEIGVRMVADFFEMEGWDTYYLGANTPVTGIVRAVVEYRPDAVAISATMSYHVTEVADVLNAIKSAHRHPPKLLVGGYPFSVDRELWQKVGADGWASNASEAVELAIRLIA